MTPLYYQLVCKIFSDSIKKMQICIIGDRNQSIFGYKGSDPRFISMSEKIFNFNDYKWITCKLPNSFRITFEMSELINNCFYGKTHITSNKITNVLPKYIICNPYDDDILLDELENYLKIYKPEEIFILAPSVKSEKSSIRNFENKIKERLNIQVYVPWSDDEKIDENVTNGKLVFLTFHQAKGLERKVSIVFNIDYSYFLFYNKKIQKNSCSNEIYVALTRSSEQLLIIHDYKYDFMFNNIKQHIFTFANVICTKKIKFKYIKTPPKNETSVLNLIKHLSFEVMDKCLEYYIEITKNIRVSSKILNIKTLITFDKTTENVSDLTGTFIPAYYELITTGKMSISEKDINNNKDDKKYDLEKIKKNLTIDSKIDELLYLTNCYCSTQSGYLFKLYQVTNYEWIKKNNLDDAIERLSSLKLNKDTEYEVLIVNEENSINICGVIDCISGNNIYEFKCVDILDNTHILQLALYMYLYENAIRYKDTTMPKTIMNNYYLYNILTDEMISIKSNLNNLQEMVNYLINEKSNDKLFNDIEFVNNLINIKNTYNIF